MSVRLPKGLHPGSILCYLLPGLLLLCPGFAPAAEYPSDTACVEVAPQPESESFRFEDSPPHEALAEQVPSGTVISSIRLKRFKVFDLSDPAEDNRVYRWANSFHFNTHESVIRDQLLVEAGDGYNLARLKESERILRNLKFIYDARVRPWRWCGDEVDLEVVTRDIWTFTPTVSFSRSGGENESALGFRDTNFLGSGKQIALRYESDDERTGTTVIYADPGIMGSRWETRISFTENDDGHERLVRLDRPFFSIYERWAAGFAVRDAQLEEKIWYRGDEVEEFDHSQKNFRISGGIAPELQAEHRVGRWLAGYRYEDHEFDYSDSDIPPDELPADRTYSYPFIGFESIEDDYIEAQNLDYLGRTEDVFVGERYLWNLGYSAEGLGATRDQLVLEGHYSNTLAASRKVWWEVESHLSGYWSLNGAEFENFWWTTQTRYLHRQAHKWSFFADLRVDYTDGLTGDQQLTLGGQNGLRGYDRYYQVGDRSAVLNLEQRYYSDWHPLRLVRVGFAAFLDVGRAWYSNRDNGSNGGVLSNAGIGLRLNSSRADKGSVIHLDLAFPFNKDDDVDSMQFLVTVKETF